MFTTHKLSKRTVDLTPLVSIVFLLIIFFLLAGTIRSPAFWQIDLAKSEQLHKSNKHFVDIYLNQHGKFAYEKKTLNLEKIQSILKKQGILSKIQIHADHRVDALKLVQLLDVLKGAQIKQVYLVTRK